MLRRRHRSYAHLLVLCLLLIGAYGLPPGWGQWLAVASFVLLPLALLRGIGQPSPGLPFPRWARRTYRLLGLLSLAAFLFWHLTPVGLTGSGLPVLVLWTLFVGWSTVRLVKALAGEMVVCGAVLRGAMAGYLLMGLTAGLLFGALETVHPGSFTSVHHENGQLLVPQTSLLDPETPVRQLDLIRFHYFALVTLTTTGYGDILPVTPQAQMASVVLALAGTIYVAVVMALLISRLTVQESVAGKDGQAGDPAIHQSGAGVREGEGPRD